jgi:MEMO1 family protein
MRRSVFDGSFYPLNKAKLDAFIRNATEEATMPEKLGSAVSYVAPHAGYAYSGKIAAFTYKAIKTNPNIENIDTIIVVGPNHTGLGRPISVSGEDWETPMGRSLNDRELSSAIAGASEYIEMDEQAHENEHSIEVQLPFLQCLFPKKRLAFICMGDQSTEASEILSKSIISAAEGLKRRIIVIASSDFNHYEPADVAKRKDSMLFDAIKNTDYRKFNRLVEEVNDSACGFGPITVAMLFARHSNAKNGLVLKYGNSGDATGDYSSVVAYSSIAFL